MVWQLIPDKLVIERDQNMYENIIEETDNIPLQWLFLTEYDHTQNHKVYIPLTRLSWQELGYWHIGRTQLKMQKYNIDGGSYYHNDMVNSLRSQYMMMTFQPNFEQFPFKEASENTILAPDKNALIFTSTDTQMQSTTFLDSMFTTQPMKSVQSPWTYVKLKQQSQALEMDIAAPEVTEDTNVIKKAVPKRRKIVTGSIIHSDGSTEVQMLQSL